MFERFTDRARRVVVLAQEEARMLNHDHIGTEHILLGLIHEGEGVACRALRSLGVSLEAVRGRVQETVGEGTSAPTGHITFTPRAKKVLELSLKECQQLGHHYIGTEHILLGLIREGGVGAKTLNAMGISLDGVRQQVIQILGGEPGAVRLETMQPHVEQGPQHPRCPRCNVSLEDALAFRTLSVKQQDGDEERDVVVVFCNRCGNALGAF
jgi:ATP-dependent Clp protease ATP-binding subunit ClpC